MSSIGSCVIYRSCLNLNLWNREIDLVIALSWSWSLKLFWLRGICGISEVNYRFIYHGLTRHSLVFLPLCWPLYLLIFSRSAATLLISLIGGNKETETPLKRISLTHKRIKFYHLNHFLLMKVIFRSKRRLAFLIDDENDTKNDEEHIVDPEQVN